MQTSQQHQSLALKHWWDDNVDIKSPSFIGTHPVLDAINPDATKTPKHSVLSALSPENVTGQSYLLWCVRVRLLRWCRTSPALSSFHAISSLSVTHTNTHSLSISQQSWRLDPNATHTALSSLCSSWDPPCLSPSSLLLWVSTLQPNALASPRKPTLSLLFLSCSLPPPFFLSVSSIFFVCYKDTLAPGPSGPQEKTTLSLWTPTVNKCIPGCLTVWMSWISLFLNIHNCSCEDFGFLLFLHSRFKHCMAKQWHCSVICSIRVNVLDLKMY